MEEKTWQERMQNKNSVSTLVKNREREREKTRLTRTGDPPSRAGRNESFRKNLITLIEAAKRVAGWEGWGVGKGGVKYGATATRKPQKKKKEKNTKNIRVKRAKNKGQVGRQLAVGAKGKRRRRRRKRAVAAISVRQRSKEPSPD